MCVCVYVNLYVHVDYVCFGHAIGVCMCAHLSACVLYVYMCVCVSVGAYVLRVCVCLRVMVCGVYESVYV